MANSYRHRKEFDRKRRYPVIALVALFQGDLSYYDKVNDTLKPAGDLSYLATLLLTQIAFAQQFAGMCAQYCPLEDGHLSEVLVDTDGVKEFSCASATWKLGDLVGIDDNAAGTALVPQQVIKVTDPRAAIGYCAQPESVAVTSVLISLFPPKLLAPLASQDNVRYFEHVVTAGEDAAGLVDIDTGLGVPPTHIQATIITVTTSAQKAGVAITMLAGKVRFADVGGVVLDAGDVIYLSIIK